MDDGMFNECPPLLLLVLLHNTSVLRTLLYLLYLINIFSATRPKHVSDRG
jgi:hypothetical protein